MSSWGWGWKFSNLQQVDDFSIFWFQTCHFFQRIIKRILNIKLGGQNFWFSAGVEVIKYEFWWGVSSISGGVGGINFEFLVVLSFDQFRILLRILLRSFPKGFTNNFTKHFTKDFNKDLSLVLVLSRAKRPTRGRTTARCERNGIDGWTAYFIIHASIFTLSWSHLYNVPSGSRPKHLKTRPKAEFTDGWMDGTEYQKCPSMFFILCGYIHKVYTYLYR